jgi:DNA-binding GntR family transcriptional regulator
LNKTEKIYKKLLDDILKGRFYQGQRLIEKELIGLYKISKTPLREALIRLERVGLIQKNVNRGFLVKPILRKDAEEIYELREIIDGLSVRKITENITEEKIQKIEKIIRNMELCIGDKKIDKYIEYDKYFHSVLNKLSENKRLIEIMQNLNYQINMLLKTSIKLPKRGINVSFSEHKMIFEAILNKNSIKAEEVAKKHIRKTKKAVLEHFDNLNFK